MYGRKVDFQLRDIRPDDLPAVLVMNNEAVPAVNRLDAQALEDLVAKSHRAVAVVDPDHPETVLGFALVFLPGADYDSENYRWFSARSEGFVYLDRIVVADGARGRGLGTVLYDGVFEAAREASSREVFCEVNLEPPNPGSLAFHARLGFEEIGRQATKGGTVVVSLLALTLGA